MTYREFVACVNCISELLKPDICLLVIVPSLSSLVALEVVIATTTCATSDDKADIMISVRNGDYTKFVFNGGPGDCHNNIR